MEKTKVIIENWPSTPWGHIWVPIFIASIALVISWIELNRSKKENIRNSRPYVWASNYTVVGTFAPRPDLMGIRIKNNPAFIRTFDFTISLDNNVLLHKVDKDYFRFPDESSEYYHSVDQVNFNKIMNRSAADRGRLTRSVIIEYSAIGSEKKYKFTTSQQFNVAANQWQEVSTFAN